MADAGRDITGPLFAGWQAGKACPRRCARAAWRFANRHRHHASRCVSSHPKPDFTPPEDVIGHHAERAGCATVPWRRSARTSGWRRSAHSARRTDPIACRHRRPERGHTRRARSRVCHGNSMSRHSSGYGIVAPPQRANPSLGRPGTTVAGRVARHSDAGAGAVSGYCTRHSSPH